MSINVDEKKMIIWSRDSSKSKYLPDLENATEDDKEPPLTTFE